MVAVAREQMARDSWRAGGVHSMDLSQSPHDAPASYCLLCSVVRLHLYSRGLTSNIKPIWKVTARFLRQFENQRKVTLTSSQTKVFLEVSFRTRHVTGKHSWEAR